jgi:hypothetical protein
MTADSSSSDDNNDWDLDDVDLRVDRPSSPGGEKRDATPSAEHATSSPDETPPNPVGPGAGEAAPTRPETENRSPAEHPQTTPTPSTPPSEPSSLVEKLSMIAVLLLLVGLFFWGLKNVYSEAPEGELVVFTTDFPVAGEKVTIESLETWWREPVRSGDEVDVGVVIEAELIPCARIQLQEGGSTTLQVSFRDAEDNLIGDTINLTVENGRFARSDSPEVTIHGTDGFQDAAMINAYVQQDIDPWSLVIVEAEGDEEPIVKARISAERKENP